MLVGCTPWHSGKIQKRNNVLLHRCPIQECKIPESVPEREGDLCPAPLLASIICKGLLLAFVLELL